MSNPTKRHSLARRWKCRPGPTGTAHTRTRFVIAMALTLFSITLLTLKVVDFDALHILPSGKLRVHWANLKGLTGLGCPAGRVKTIPMPNPVKKTALASFPRSGSSYTRNMVERATGFRTSALYCDYRLFSFEAECLGLDSPFLVKTHWPASKPIHPDIPEWTFFDQAIRVVRNPFDSIWSAYHFSRSRDHEARIKGVKSLSLQKDSQFLRSTVKLWAEHARYWREEAKIPVTVVRYEDLRNDGPSQLERIIDLIVPKDNRPGRRRLECATQPDPQKEPYRSKKYPIFSAWHRYDNETRAWMFEMVKDEWCKLGYNSLLTEAVADADLVDCSGAIAVGSTSTPASSSPKA